MILLKIVLLTAAWLYFKENESPEVISIHPLSEVNGEIINKETYDLIFKYT